MNISILPIQSGRFEGAVASVNASRYSAIKEHIEVIRTLWNPWNCPVSELPLLAAAHSVDIWEDWWSEHKKRMVIAEAQLYHRRKCTIAGKRMALSYRDAKLIDYHLPQHGFFVEKSASLSVEANHIASLAEIRLYDEDIQRLKRCSMGVVGLPIHIIKSERQKLKAELHQNNKIIPLQWTRKDNLEHLVLPLEERHYFIVGKAKTRSIAPININAESIAVRPILASHQDFIRAATFSGDRGRFIKARRYVAEKRIPSFTSLGSGGRLFIASNHIPRGYLSMRYGGGRIKAKRRKLGNALGKSRLQRAAYTTNWTIQWKRQAPRPILTKGCKVWPSAKSELAKLMQAILLTSPLRDLPSITLQRQGVITYAALTAQQEGLKHV